MSIERRATDLVVSTMAENCPDVSYRVREFSSIDQMQAHLATLGSVEGKIEVGVLDANRYAAVYALYDGVAAVSVNNMNVPGLVEKALKGHLPDSSEVGFFRTKSDVARSSLLAVGHFAGHAGARKTAEELVPLVLTAENVNGLVDAARNVAEALSERPETRDFTKS